jgi:hypothetical protein
MKRRVFCWQNLGVFEHGVRYRERLAVGSQLSGRPDLRAALFSMVAARSNLMPEERKQQNQQGRQGGQQQQGGGGQKGELKPKPGRGREQHQFESPKYQPQPGHGSPDDPGFEDGGSTGT